MSTAASAGMQAALLIREKHRLRRKKCRKGGRSELPSHIATKEIGPFPRYPPGFMCSQGRAAWQERERGRRCSLSEEARQHRIKQTEAHHRWMKRNRIHDSTYGGGSDDDDFFSVYHQSAAANALLYVGLGTTAIGSVIFFVGTGEKGFKTLELRLIGPTLIACGLLCCLIRVLLCALPSTCLRRRKKTRLKDTCPHSSSRYPLAGRSRHHPDFHSDSSAALLAHKHKKKVSIVPPNHSVPSTSTNVMTMGDPKEPLQPQPWQPSPPKDHHLQMATPATTTTTIPQINLPQAESVIELQSLDLVYDDIQSVTSDDDDEDSDDNRSVTVIETSSVMHQSKLARTREPANQVQAIQNNERVDETCLSVVVETNSAANKCENHRNDGQCVTARAGGKSEVNKQTHSGIVLSPLQLGQ